MNFIAHIFLADTHPDSIIGNLAGDFVKGKLDNRFEPRIKRGIQLHRHIDSYTDQHPEVQAMKRQFVPERRRFAGIVLDISFDYFLCRNWHHFSEQAIGEFIENVYEILRVNHHRLPKGLRRVAPNMVNGDWLSYYQSLDGTGEIIDRVARRLSRGTGLTGSITEIARNHNIFEERFLHMFPDVIAYAARQRRALKDQHI